jgi:hypothetical protein
MILEKICKIYSKDQMGQHDWTKAEENLQKVNGLGSLKHRKQVFKPLIIEYQIRMYHLHFILIIKVQNLFEEIKMTIGECMFDMACQAPLNQADTTSIINFLKTNCNLTQNNSSAASQDKPCISNAHLYLVMSILYCFDCSYLENKAQGK